MPTDNKKNYEEAEFKAVVMFRTIVGENGLDARDALNILNAVVVEWQRELIVQMMVPEDAGTGEALGEE